MNEKPKIAVDQNFNFKGQLINGQDFVLSDLKTPKVISFFPKLNTKICDMQTLKMVEWSKVHPHIQFISLSMDDIDVAQEWCQAHKIANLFFVSDKKYQDFANKTNLRLENQTMLKRGLIFLNEHNKIVALTINDDYKQEPNYDLIARYLN